jgi:deoxyribose-phosphate aldolase
MNAQTLARTIEHTYLKAAGPPDAVLRLCAEAITHHFAVVMVHPAELDACRAQLAGSSVRLGTVIGFPLGQNTSTVKRFEAQDAIQRGAQDLDLVLNVRALQAGADTLVREELHTLAMLCREHDCISKVILETCYLTDDQKKKACDIALETGIDYVKTSTGFGSGGATLADVRLMRQQVGDQAGVKASGGIRNLADAQAMLAAGADRLGTSSGVALLQELDAQA